MSENIFDKDTLEALDEFDKLTPYASYLSDSTLSTVEEWIDTGSMVLNALISGSLYKGIPVGRVVQFAGPSQTFKSGFVQQILANAQKMGKKVIIIDTENAIDKDSAAGLGLDCDRVKYITPDSIEHARNLVYAFLKKVKEKGLEGQFIIAIDSIANMQSEMELKRMDKDSTSADMGTFAKSIKSLLKTCTNMGALTKTTFVITNHVYDDPSAMYPSLEKNMAGGKSAVYLPSVTVQLARKLVKDDEMQKQVDKTSLATAQKSYSGVVIRALTAKNRFIKQYLEGEMYLSFSTGLNKYYGLLEIMKGMGVIDNKGSIYYAWNGDRLGYQKDFRSNTELWDSVLIPELEKRILSEWSYGNLKADGGSNDILDDNVPEEELEVKETALDKLKKSKKRVSKALDELEKEEND